MWKITYISCIDFISFKEAELEIPQNVCSLIYGLNNDNMQQRNNGTGKSSIIEAIAFALTGEPLRAVDKVEEIINDHSDTAYVYIELENDFDNTLLTIKRTINRKSAQVIECHKYQLSEDDRCEIEQNKTSQPTVLDYNRYILEEIGLTKDDIYSNFILSNSKYKSFFDASDKTKKAMINRFSGADAIDGAIERLKQDMAPAEFTLNRAKDAKIAVDAKLEVVCGQLLSVQEKKAEWKNEKQERIKALQNQISQKREELRNNKEQIVKANTRLDAIDEAGARIEDMQDTDIDLEKGYSQIADVFKQYNLTPIKDYIQQSVSIAKSITTLQKRQAEAQHDLVKAQRMVDIREQHFNKVKVEYDALKAENEKLDAEDKADLQDIEKDIETTQGKIADIVADLDNLQDKADRLDRNVRQLNNQLHGAIVCPKCQHEFFLDEDFSVNAVKEEASVKKETLDRTNDQIQVLNGNLQKYKNEQVAFENEKKSVVKEIEIRNDKLSALAKELRDTSAGINEAGDKKYNFERVMKRLQDDIDAEQGRINGLMKQMFSEALDIIDNTITRGERYVKTLEEGSVAINASIESFEKTMKEVESSTQNDLVDSLNKSKAEYEKALENANKELETAQKAYDKFVVQENYFVDFRSYLANKKVEAIAGITNHFLELIGSDLRVEMLGYKKLKSGKVRDKITVNLLRNGVDCGSYAKFSGGERARVNLASILGLQKLTNNSVPKGKGLDLLVLDEILEASDTTGIESSCKALNKLRTTSLLVTQNPISDNDGNTIVVVKENGYSTIKE